SAPRVQGRPRPLSRSWRSPPAAGVRPPSRSPDARTRERAQAPEFPRDASRRLALPLLAYPSARRRQRRSWVWRARLRPPPKSFPFGHEAQWLVRSLGEEEKGIAVALNPLDVLERLKVLRLLIHDRRRARHFGRPNRTEPQRRTRNLDRTEETVARAATGDL